MIKTILTIIFIIICVIPVGGNPTAGGQIGKVCPVPSAVWLTATGAEIKPFYGRKAGEADQICCNSVADPCIRF